MVVRLRIEVRLRDAAGIFMLCHDVKIEGGW